MAKSSRTIIHYSLRVLKNTGGTTANPLLIKDCINYINGLSKIMKKYEDDGVKKFHVLDSVKSEAGFIMGRFTSAKYDYRPPLIDKDSMGERISPKKITEGEKELTHYAATFDSEDALLLLEQRRAGISINTVVRYLNKYLHTTSPGHHIVAGLSVKGDFDSKLKSLHRAISVEVFVPYNTVTDTFQNESIATKNVKKEASITISAERSTSISETAKDIYRLMTNKTADIRRIKIYGKSDNCVQTLLDTNRLKDKSTVNVELDKNSQVISASMLDALKITMETLL